MCMASGITLDADKINKEKRKWEPGNKVYTRRPKKVLITATETDAAVAVPVVEANNDETRPEISKDLPGVGLRNGEVERETVNRVVRPFVSRVDNRVKICLVATTPKNEIKGLEEKLKGELEQVRGLVKRLEDKETEIAHHSTVLGTTSNNNNNDGSYSQLQGLQYPTVLGTTNNNNDGSYSQLQGLQYAGDVTTDGRSLLRDNSEMATDYMDRRALTRVYSEMGSGTDRRALTRVNSEMVSVPNQDMNRLRQLSVSVGGDYAEKEKRTPKANQYYQNSDFLLGKDRLPPESNKKPKLNGASKSEYSVALERHKKQAFRSCNTLLQRLMKHKNGWVFNEPVNAKLLGLHDYHDFIKHPMDLGTVKSRLSQNFYKTPVEFAEDVRLTFRNAMTYNPRGHDVHAMAEQLLNIFEERWAVIEYDWRNGAFHDAGMPTPTSGKVTNHRTFDRSQSMALPFMARPKPATFAPVTRTPVPKKPKAKDPNKRDMTYDEKQKLSANLQNLPSEKLDNIVQIIKKSNTSLSQNDEEIEVDIDSIDVETLWELDRFVTNYKKNLSKHKRRAELSQQARELAVNTNPPVLENPTALIPEVPIQKRADEKIPATGPPNQGENRGDNVSRSSSSSSSSSDSGTSSSDSDSDSSSSDEGHSPRT
uniref:transcription factor GTE3, chloroplastic-like isoform X2 n=1 Tax=Erigeron canadensis TaxID=72917 RepID=UPI001CB8A6BA|nr:transcription factor GTE3, chloroplastic-like isoform X2 [Erigeron canadensis]